MKKLSLDEIEDIYSEDLNKCEENFYKGLKNKEDRKILESSLKDNLALSRKKYYDQISTALQNSKPKKEKEKRKKKEKFKHYKVDQSPTSLSLIQRLKIKFRLMIFHSHFSLKRKISQKTPELALYEHTKFRFFIKKHYLKATHNLEMLEDKIRSLFDKLLESLKKLGKKLYSLSVEIPEKIIEKTSKIFKKKKKTEDNPLAKLAQSK